MFYVINKKFENLFWCYYPQYPPKGRGYEKSTDYITLLYRTHINTQN